MIPRYTRAELAEVWSDHARFEAMRQVEVAASEELDGPSADGARRDPGGDVHRRGDQRTREGHRPRHRRVRRRAVRLGGSRRALDPPRADLERRPRHRSRAPASPGGRDRAPGLPAAGGGARRAAREHVAYAVRRAHPRHPRRADHVRDQARRVRVRGGAERGSARRAFAQAAVGALSGAVGTLLRHLARVRGARARASRAAARAGLDPGGAARPPRRAAAAIALAGAGLERFATEVRHLARTEVGEVREPFGRGQKGSSSMPHKRNPIKSEQVVGLARVLRGTRCRLWRTSRYGTSATSRTRR